MAQNEIVTKGTLKASKHNAGGANTRDVPVFGIVKDNIDPTRSGRLKVFLSDNPGAQDSNTSQNWVSVSYLATFFGKVQPSAGNNGNGEYISNPSSYGMWTSPPDIGTKVICIFVNGDPNYGFWIGSVPEPESLYMIPAIGASDHVIPNTGEGQSYGGAVRLPVTNFNTNNQTLSDNPNFLDSPRPIHSYSASIMMQQGIIRDPIRGPIGSSAQRESPSRVGWGVSTPGRPIYDGGFTDETLVQKVETADPQQLKVVARRGGHTIVMDDGDVVGKDQLVRIRTALGHQILMSDDGQTLMILHSNGQSYIELGKEGTVDIFSTNSFNVRTQGDINLHADRNVNIHAMENLNFKAKNINIDSEKKIQVRAGEDLIMSAIGKLTGLAGGPISWGSKGEVSMVGGGNAYLNGKKVNLNSGAPSNTPKAADAIPLVAQTDTLFDTQKGFLAAPGKLLTIASRAPAHAPWSAAGKGVDVKTSPDADANLPSKASPAASNVLDKAISTVSNPVAAATAASAPVVGAVSNAIDKNVTGAVLGAVATNAAAGPAAEATTVGSAVVDTVEGPVAAIGAYASTPTQLADAGIIKPGSDTLVNGLIKAGVSISNAMPSAVFSGVSGAGTVGELVQNVSAQTAGVTTNLQQAQTALTNIGAISGNEGPGVMAGLVTGAATVGADAVAGAMSLASGVAGTAAGAVNGAVGAVTGAASGLVNGALGAVTGAASGLVNGALGAVSGLAGQALSAIGSGLAAANIAASIGGLSGINDALSALTKVPTLSGLIDSTRGTAAACFSGIVNSIPTLTPNVPVNLTQLAQQAAVKNSVIGAQSSQTGTNLINGVVSTASSGVSALTSVASLALGSAVTAGTGNILGAVSNINNTVAGVAGSAILATNLTSMITNSSTPVVATVGGATAFTGLIASATSSATSLVNTSINSINTVTATGGVQAALSTGGIPLLTQTANVIQSGAATAATSAIASGVNAIPGALNTVNNVVNNATNAVVSTGLTSVNNLITNAASNALNGLPIPNISGALGSLSSLATAGLPAGVAAELTSKISSLSSSSGGLLSLPIVSFNTNSRDSITSQITSTLGNPKIPVPNLLGEVSQGAITKLDELKQKAKTLATSVANVSAVSTQLADTSNKLLDAPNNYLAGDPAIDNLNTQAKLIANDPIYNMDSTVINDHLNSGTASTTTSLVTGDMLTASTNFVNSTFSTVSDVTTANTESTTTTTTNTTVYSSASSVLELQANVQTNLANINNSISGIIGPTTI